MAKRDVETEKMYINPSQYILNQLFISDQNKHIFLWNGRIILNFGEIYYKKHILPYLRVASFKFTLSAAQLKGGYNW